MEAGKSFLGATRWGRVRRGEWLGGRSELKRRKGSSVCQFQMRSGGSELGSSGQKGREDKVPELAAGAVAGGAPGARQGAPRLAQREFLYLKTERGGPAFHRGSESRSSRSSGSPERTRVCACVRVCVRVRALGASRARRGEAGARRGALGTRLRPAGPRRCRGGDDPAPGAARCGLHSGRLLHVAAAAGPRVQPPAPSSSCSSCASRSRRQPRDRRPAAAAVACTPASPWDR